MKTVAFTGRRPQKLPGGFDEEHPLNTRIKQQLDEGIRRAYNAGAREFISGGAVGVDMWAAESVLRLKNELPDIRLRMVIPFEGQEAKWPAASQERYNVLRSQADAVQILSAGGYDPKKLFQRNRAMVDQADALISVFEGKKEGGTWDAIRYAMDRKKPVWNINPRPEYQAAGDSGHTIRSALSMTRREPDPEALSYVRKHMRGLRAGMPGSFEDYAVAIEHTLNQARVSEPYGVLKYANAEFQSTSLDVPGAVQEHLGMYVRSKYEQLHQAYLKNNPGVNISYEAYIAKYPDARRRAAAMPADLSGLLRTNTGKASIGSYFPTLKQARTVGDVEEFLFNSVKQGFKATAARVGGSLVDPQDILQEMELGYWEKAPLYSRQATNAAGKTVNVPYQIFSQWAAFSRGTDVVRAEEEYQQGIAGTYDESGGEEIQNGVYSDSAALGDQGALPSDIGPREEAPAGAGIGQADLAARQASPDKERQRRWGGYTARTPHVEVDEIDPNSAYARAGGREGAVIHNIRGLSPEEAAAFAEHLEGGGQLDLMVSEPGGASAGGGHANVQHRQRRITIQGQPASRRLRERSTKYDWLDELADRMEPAEPNVVSLEGARTRELPAKVPARSFNTGLYTTPDGASGPLAGENGLVPISAKPTDQLSTPLMVGRRQASEFRDYLAAREAGIPEAEQESAGLIRRSFNRINEGLSSGGSGEASAEHSADEFSAALDAAVRGTDENEGDLLAQEFDPYDQDTSILGSDPQYLEDTYGLEIPEDPEAAEGRQRKWIADKSQRNFQFSAKRGVEAVNYANPDPVIKNRLEMDQAESSPGEELEPRDRAAESHEIKDGASVVQKTRRVEPPAQKDANPDYLGVDASDIGTERDLNEAYAEASRHMVTGDISSRAARQVATRGRKASILSAVTGAESAESARFYRALDHPENTESLASRRKWARDALEAMRRARPRRAANIAYIGARSQQDAGAFAAALRQVVGDKTRALGAWIAQNPNAPNIAEAKRSYSRLRSLKLYQYGKEAEWGDQFAGFEAAEPRLAADIRAASGMPTEAQVYDRLKAEDGAVPEAPPARAAQPDPSPAIYRMGMEPDYAVNSIFGRVHARRPRGSTGGDPLSGDEGGRRRRNIEDLPPARNVPPARAAGGNGRPPAPPEPPDNFIDSLPEPPDEDPDFWSRTTSGSTSRFDDDSQQPGQEPSFTGGNGARPADPQPSRRLTPGDDGPLINHPAAFPKKPRPGMILEAEMPGESGQPGSIRVLEARRTGSGAVARMAWMEQDEEGSYHEAANVPGWGVVSRDGEILADVSHEDYQSWQEDRARRLEERAARQQAQGTPSQIRRTRTPEEKALAAARGIGVEHINRLNARELGAAREVSAGSGTYQMERVDDQWNTQVTMSAGNIQSAHGIAQTAAANAMRGNLPTNPIARVATIQERIINNALKGVEEFVDKQIQEGVSPDIARANGEKFRQVVKHFADAAAKVVGQTLTEEYGVQPSDVSAARYGAVYLKNREEVSALLERSPEARRQLGGRTPEQVASSGEEFTVIDEEGRPFDIGSYGKYNRYRGNGRQGGLWGGRMGSLMYGAYLLQREWQMAFGQTTQAADAYGKYMENFAFSLPEGVSAGSTDIGFNTRQELGSIAEGRAAYQTFGSFMELPYYLSRNNPAASRLLTTAKASAGLIMNTQTTAAMMAMAGGEGSMMAAAGSMLGTAGLIGGGLLLGTQAAFEGYNAFLKPEGAEDLSLGGMFRDARALSIRESAREKLAGRYYGASYPQRPDSMKGMNPYTWQYYKSKTWYSDEEMQSVVSKDDWRLLQSYNTPPVVEHLTGMAVNIAAETAEAPETVASGLSMQKTLLGAEPDEERGQKISRAAMSRGVASGQQMNEAARYAAGFGYKPGTPEFIRAFEQYGFLTDPKQLAEMMGRSQKTAMFGSQLNAMMPNQERYQGFGEDLVSRYGMDQMKTGLTASYAQVMQTFGPALDAFGWEQAAAFGSTTTPYVGRAATQAMELGGIAGLGQSDIGSIGAAFSGMNTQDAFLMDRVLGGDLRAASHQAWQNGSFGSRLFDRSGNSIWETNGSMAIQWARANSSRLTTGAWAKGNQSDRSLAAILTGSNNNRILDTFMQSGTRGIEALSRIDQANASAALAGIQMRGLELQENFLWGASSGGKWNAPTAHSSWGIEDQLLSLQHQSTLASFADQQQRMTLSNQFAIRREDNQSQRMNASHQFSQWQWSASYNQFNQQQAWAREDWQYQDTTRQLNFGWQMEDLNEAIRFSSGRERKRLVRQRDRAALSQNLEEGQVETQRDRQEQLWAQEDERFQKQKQYMDEMQRLDQESFAINKEQREAFYKLDQEAFARRMKEYEEQKKLEDEMRELNRKYQYDQIQLQKEAAAIQAGAAASQKEYYETLLKTNQTMGDMKGEFEDMNTYDAAFRLITAAGEMFKTADSVSTYRIDKILELLRAIAQAAPAAQSNLVERE